MSARVFFSLEEARGQFGPCALTIGNFDGVHLGHRALISATCRHAAAHGIAPAVMAFHPHPTVVVAPQRVPKLLCSLDERIRLLAEAGAERILILPFNEELSCCSPEQFIRETVVEASQAKAIFVGRNFRFGHKQAGTPETLVTLGREYGFEPGFIEPFTLRGCMVSSSLIREHLAAGRVSLAGRMLGRCFSLQGAVVSGRGIGSTQTVPTLNLQAEPELLVPRGVFITETLEPATGRRWRSITNAGVRPTFGGGELTIETFLLSPLAGASPEFIKVDFHRFVRGERQFPDAAELKAQIMKDVSRAQSYWRRAGEMGASLSS